MKGQSWQVIPRPFVQRLADGTYYASSSRFPDLWALERSAEAAAFVLRLLLQKRLYGQAWTWGPEAATMPRS